MDPKDIKQSQRKKDIAIIGMSGRFPKSDNIELFWNNLVAGKELIRTYKPDELVKMGVDEKLIKDPNYIWSNSMIDHPESFDHNFFGYTKGEAELMDPQTRLMHEQVWLALEDAACNPDEYKGKIGLYLSASDNLNWRAHALLNPNHEVGAFMSRRLADKSFISTLISYNLDLRGPSYYTDTACSSALTALHIACRSLLMKECSIALAGASSIITSKEKGYRYEEGMISSKDGHCRAFDKDASGTFFGEGIGVIVLKRFEEAINDKDHIYAVIRSTAVNNDGKRKVGYTAPSVNGQAECISLAHKIAGVEPESISYIEAHGTATRIGDSIEVEALNKAFNYNREHRCAIGSVKSNLGHLDALAGIVGVIKTGLALKHKTLPPSINYSSPNPDINFGSGPFYVNKELQAWERNGQELLRAGVSSFGIGGTNAHAILEEAPSTGQRLLEKKHRLLICSANTVSALNNYRHRLTEFIQENETLDLQELAYTLQLGRKQFRFRDFLVYDGDSQLWEGPESQHNIPAVRGGTVRTVFMFSGGGSQYFGMARQLYMNEPYFKMLMDEGFAKLADKTGKDFKKVMGYAGADGADSELINAIQYMLPALFLVEYSIAKLLMHIGVRPDYMIGHSLGEYVAACISGVFSFDDALSIVIKRAELTDTVPEGGMVGVDISADKVQPYLTNKLSIAAINMQDSCVVSGPKEEIQELIHRLELDSIEYTELKISVAAHSSMFDPILEEYAKALHEITLLPPQIPFVSNLSGKEITAEEATSAAYWVKHLRHTVNFLSGIACLLEKGTANYIEIGSGGILTSFLKQHPLFKAENFVVNVLRHPKEAYDDHAYYLRSVGKLWANGVTIDWPAFNGHEKYNKVPAPGYVFDKTDLQVRVDPFRRIAAEGAVWNANTRNLQQSLFFHNWKKSIFRPGELRHGSVACYLVFADADGKLSGMIDQLKTMAEVIVVSYGGEYEENEQLFTIDPFNQTDYERLFRSLEDRGLEVAQVLYNWNIRAKEDLLMPSLPVTYLCQQLIVYQAQHLKKFTFISRFGFQVAGNETIDIPLNLAKETAEMVIRNNAGVFTCYIDIDLDEHNSRRQTALLNDIVYNFSDACIAYRDDTRWIRFYDKIKVDEDRHPAVLKKNRNYLIVNGTGKTGRILSDYLTAAYDATLIVTVEQAGENKQLSGPASENVDYYQTDIYDKEVFRQLISQVEGEHGKISGVIFIGNEHEISDLSSLDNLIRIQSRKLLPIQHLYDILKDHSPDFIWMPLMLSSEINKISECMYADAFAGMFAIQHRKEIPNWYTVTLDDLHTGDSKDQEIITLFELSLSQDLHTAIVSFQDIDALKKNLSKRKLAAAVPEENKAMTNYNYVAPEGRMEAEICELWQSFLAAGSIGAVDNFFELGGNSLKAMTMLKRVQKQYNVQIDLKDFYTKPTVRLLAEEINIAMMVKSQTTKKERNTLKI